MNHFSRQLFLLLCDLKNLIDPKLNSSIWDNFFQLFLGNNSSIEITVIYDIISLIVTKHALLNSVPLVPIDDKPQQQSDDDSDEYENYHPSRKRRYIGRKINITHQAITMGPVDKIEVHKFFAQFSGISEKTVYKVGNLAKSLSLIALDPRFKNFWILINSLLDSCNSETKQKSITLNFNEEFYSDVLQELKSYDRIASKFESNDKLNTMMNKLLSIFNEKLPNLPTLIVNFDARLVMKDEGLLNRSEIIYKVLKDNQKDFADNQANMQVFQSNPYIEVTKNKLDYDILELISSSINKIFKFTINENLEQNVKFEISDILNLFI